MKEVVTSVDFDRALLAVNLTEGVKACAVRFLRHEFKSSEQQNNKKRKGQNLGGNREKRYCKDMASLGIQLGAEGLAAI
eukprot:3895790-Pleurochrysis_carterae.AAC.1